LRKISLIRTIVKIAYMQVGLIIMATCRT